MLSFAPRQALAPLIDAIFPPRCPLCGAMLTGHDGLCGACWAQLTFPGDPACELCPAPVLPEGPARCERCSDAPPRHAGVVAATCYDAISRQLVLRLKHGRQIALAAMMARMMASRLPREGLAGWALVPVPLHRWRLWRRGYNQSALLTHELAGLTGGTPMVDALIRCRRTPSLGGLDRAERALALQGAIIPHSRRALRERRVMLVDDVLTSGATSAACVDALLTAGAKEVRIVCFARVMHVA